MMEFNMFIMPLGKDYCSAKCRQKRLPDHLKPPFVLLSFGPLAFPVNWSQWLLLLFIFQSFTYLNKSTGCARFMDQKLCGNIWVQLDLLDQLLRNWVRCPLNKNRVVPMALSSFSDLVLTPHLIQHFLQDNSHLKCLVPCQGREDNGKEGWGERMWHFLYLGTSHNSVGTPETPSVFL